MRVLITGMSGAGKSTLIAELRRRGRTAYDADDHGFSEPRDDGRWGWRAPRETVIHRLRTRSHNPYGRDDRERAQVLADLDQIEPMLRRSSDLIVETTAPVDRVADQILEAVARSTA